jgi:hypothetical protein
MGNSRLGNAVSRIGILPILLLASACGFSPNPDTQAPTFSLASGIYSSDQILSIHCDSPKAIIRYEIDGSWPTSSSPIYSVPFSVKGDCSRLRISAVASVEGRKDSETTYADVSVVYLPAPAWSEASIGYYGEIREICFGNGMFLAFSAYSTGNNLPYRGEALISPDGLSWSSREAPWSGWPELLFDGIRFVAAKNNHIFASVDAIAWTQIDLPAGFECTGLAYGSRTYVAVGEGGMIYSSPDAQVWTCRQERDVHDLYGIAFGDSGFIAIGYGGETKVSADGIIWRDAFGGLSCLNDYYLDIAFGAGAYAITTRVETLVGGNKHTWNSMQGGVDFANDRFFSLPSCATSVDGATWKDPDGTARRGISHVAYGNGVYVATQDGYRGIMTSADGFSWQESGAFAGSIYRVDACDPRFVALGRGGELRVSTDGSTWDAMDSGTSEELFAAASGNGCCVAVGSNGTILRSADYSQWSDIESGINGNIVDVAFGAGIFVAIAYGGGSGTIITSRDGLSWTAESIGVADSLDRVIYGNGNFVIEGTRSLFRSTDGITWTACYTPDMHEIDEFLYSKGRFCLRSWDGNQAEYYQSVDCQNWSEFISQYGIPQKAVDIGVRSVGSCDGSILISAEGLSWAFCYDGPWDGKIMDIAAIGGICVAVSPCVMLVSK